MKPYSLLAGIFSCLIFLIVPAILLFFYLSPVKSQSETQEMIYASYPVYRSVPVLRSTGPNDDFLPLNEPGEVTPLQSKSDFCLNIPILYYHHIQPYTDAVGKGQTSLTVDSSVFDSQMADLSQNGFHTVSADELANALRTHTNLPPKTVVITIDDGYKDNFTYAFPILQKYGLKANVMIATGLMEGPDMLSWNDLRTMVSSGVFNAYDHTWSHAALAGASFDKVQAEVITAKKELEDQLGKPVNIFTYPYGSHDDRVAEILVQDGFIAAFSTIAGETQCESFIMSLHRTRIGNGPLSSYGL